MELETDLVKSKYLISHLDLSDLSGVELAQVEVAQDLADAAQALTAATSECGFIYVKLSSQNANTIENMRRAQRAFFAQPLDEKNRISIDLNNRGYLADGMAQMHGARRRDQKEVFFWGREADAHDADVKAGLPLCGPNQWPAIDGFREAVSAYSQLIQSVGDKLLRIIAVALGAPATFFEKYYERSMLRGQLLCYPPTLNDPDQFGVAPHSDFGCITLLLQETPGLEVMFPDGEWVAAPPVENTLIINIGDLLERWSNKRFPSTKHRVRNRNEEARYSIAMFYDPNPGATICPTDLLPGEDPKFQPVTAAEYILGRNKGAFDHYKTK